MKKNILIVIFFICNSVIFATEQMPDYLFYNGKKLLLSTGWGHPSPLQTYYQQNGKKYPFQMCSTANYRGHIATWEIENNKFLLKEIKVLDDVYRPEEYDIKSGTDTIIQSGVILADWFTGILSCQSEKKSKELYLFYVRKGEILETQIITEKDYKKLQNISDKATANQELMRKYCMLILNQNYISYYFRLSSEDQLSNGDKSGRFVNKQGFSPILDLFDNSHANWPYNWDNFEKTGAPCCKWIINDNRVYLTEINLHSGTSFFEVAQSNVPLDDLFKTEVDNGKVYADWLSGIFTIQHGEEKEDALLTGFKEFKIDSVTYLRISNGIILEEYTVPANYTKRGIPEKAENGLKKILEELQ